MLSIQEKILLYFDLPEDEQANVDRYILEHPELVELFAESQALHALISAARGDELPNTSTLTNFVLFSGMKAVDPPADVAARHARVEAAIREHPELQVDRKSVV